MSENYVVYHSHTDLSNPTAGTGADSVTKFSHYIQRASELGMSALSISEHGNVMNWIKKKETMEKAGLKYIHANEIYLTQHTDKSKGLVRDNFHYMLLAKNYDGVKEINQLTSNSFNREDGHFYYNPRISFDELKNTSDNIIMTSACLASPLWRLYKQSETNTSSKIQFEELLNWMGANKHRMFFEIQYHNHPEQVEFNRLLLQWSKDLNIPLIAGTDTHSLNKEHATLRQLFLKSKGANYGDEDTFDLTFKSYDELVNMFEVQNAIPRDEYLEAIHNTNVMADMVEEFELDKTPKYPKLYDKPVEVFKQKINEGVIKRGVNKFDKEKKDMYFKRIKEEFDTYMKLDAIDYMLLQKNIIDWCHNNGIYQGYGRGSVNGSLIAYLLGITEMDSIKHNLNFFRFLNPDRISLPDIDVDFPPSRRQDVIDYLANLEGIEFSEIITFNTFADKGAVRQVCKGLEIPLSVEDEIAKGLDDEEERYRKQYPEVFKYSDLLNGVVFAMGSHPSGFVVSPINLDENVSTLYTKESKYRVTAVNMKELDGENYVKLDILGLANIELINETCKLAGIERLTPDNINTKDNDVWKSLTKSTLGVFQFESDSAYGYIKLLFSDKTLNRIKEQVGELDYIDLLSIANGALRPSGESYRYELARGNMNNSGHKSLNEFLKPTLGYLVFQEQIMNFLTDFCEHTGAESDSVRRGLAKKVGTEQFLPKIREGFIHYMIENYNETEENAEKILKGFLKVIEDASDYGFSVNHSQPYSYIGYIGAYLRYYYPLEFLTVMLNLNDNDKDKTTKIVSYANKIGIQLKPISFGKSRSVYNVDKDENSIYKGLTSIKYLNAKISEELYILSHKEYDKDKFYLLVKDIIDETSVNSAQMEILIRLDFFREFGEKEVLLEIYEVMSARKFKRVVDGKEKQIARKANFSLYPEFKGVECFYKTDHSEKTKTKRLENITKYEEAVRLNPPPKYTVFEQISFEKEKLGYAISTWNVNPNICLITDIIKKGKGKPRVILYQVSTGKEFTMKVEKKKFYLGDLEEMLYIGDVIKIEKVEEKPTWTVIDGKFKQNKDVLEPYLEKAKILRSSPKRKHVVTQ